MSNHQILDSATHADLRINTGAGAELGDGVMATLVVPDEFRRTQGSYPIVFRRDDETGGFTAMALFGFEDGENLFLKEGQWDEAFRPMSLAIQPFLIGRAAGSDGEDRAQVHVDMGHPRISSSGEGVRVFDEDGQATPYLEGVIGMLEALHMGYQGMGAFFDALQRHELIEPFTLEVGLNDGSKNSLVGFHTIAEEKLRALDGDALGDLHNHGHLMPAFMAMASLSQFSELVARKNAKVAHG